MNWQIIKKWTAKISLYLITLIIGLFFLVFVLVQLPAVQLRISNAILSSIEKQTGYTGKFDRFYLLWYDRLQFNNFTLTDPENNDMLQVGSFYMNFNLSRLILKRDIFLEAAIIQSGTLYLTPIQQNDSSSTLNLVHFVDKIKALSDKEKAQRGSKINMGEMILEDMHFVLNDTRKEPKAEGIDFAHLAVDINGIELQGIELFNDTIQFQINKLRAVEQNSEITIRSLQSYFRFSPSGIELLKLNLSTEKSFISDTLRFLYDSPLALGDFINSVDIDARLKKSYLHPDDLAKLFSAASKIKDLIYIEGNFYGTVNGFAFNNMQIKNGRSTLNGNIEMYGLPDLEDTFIDLNLRNSTLITSDIAMYMKEDVREKIDEFGRINFSGEFQGFIYDFVANGILDTQYGRIVSDINLKINQDNIDLSSYSGRLRTEKFNIGKLIGDTSLFQTISMNGRLNGKGLNIEKADLQLNGRISEIGIKGYNYVNINTNARFFSQFFNGYISIDDPNLKLSTEAKIDLRPQFETIQAKGTLDYVSFHNLNLSDKFFFLSSAIDINTKGLELDSLTGSVSLHNFNLVYDENELLLDSIDILSVRDGKNRYLSVHSSMADIEMEGDFIFTSFFKDISTLVFELGLQLKNDKQAIKEYYATKGNSPSDYDVNFKFNLHDINPVINLFTQDFEISKNILFQGEYYSGYNTMLTAYSNVDSIRYTNKYFTDNIIEFNGSKISDSTSVLAMFFMNSKSQNLTSKLFTRDLSIEGVWHEERIDFSIDAYQQNVSNFINISGDVNLRRDSTQIRFNPSRLRLLENMWNIERGNRILIKGREISVKNLNIFNQNENISINGFLSDDENKLLSIDFNNVSIDIINPLIGKDLGGTMQGYIEVKNIYQSITIQNRITIYNHTINNFLVGDVTGNNEWDNEYKVFEINLAVDRLGKRIVNIQGSYDPFIIGNQLNLKADFAEANLDIIEPFLDFFVSQIKGTITGSYSISGNFDLIKINGSGRIQNGQIMINYLKTLYGFNGNIGMDTDKIIFDNIELTDINGNRGRINGNLSHKNFSDLQINLDGRFNNFQVLNTTARDNELFYGIANASGDVNFFGPLGNMKITSNAKTERGTRISIPLTSSSASVETKEYINFLNFTDASATALIEESVKTTTDLSGLNIEFNIEITPDAYCEIIFDLKAGDIIRGRGRGNIKLQLDTKGEFNMFGPIEFTEGAYNFTLYDIVNKEFLVEPGSTITWYGDPYEGQMNIRASYNQLASIAPLINITDCNAPQLRRKYPIQVLLLLEGELLSPAINFDINARDLPDAVSLEGCDQQTLRPEFEFQAFKSRLDDQELKRQVFSLIILRRFSQPDAFFSASGGIAGSVSELLSNQLSYWMTQVDENLEIDIDLGTMDAEAYNTFQLRLSYRFMDGRLRVSRDGSLAAQDNRASTASLLGDLTVEYMLSPDGKFRIKMYNRTNYNSLNLQQQSTTTAGASLLYTQSFNEIRELLQSARKRNRREDEIILDDPDADASGKKIQKNAGQN